MKDFGTWLGEQRDFRPRQVINELHATNPEPGDLWRERLFTPVCVVLALDGDDVIYTTRTLPAGEHQYTFDVEAAQRISREDFRKSLAYGAISGYWCEVEPGKGWAWVKQWNELENKPC